MGELKKNEEKSKNIHIHVMYADCVKQLYQCECCQHFPSVVWWVINEFKEQVMVGIHEASHVCIHVTKKMIFLL